jgi:hypothetical protein
LRLRRRGDYESSLWKQAKSRPDVKYRMRRISLGRRMELLERIASLVRDMEYAAGCGEPGGTLTAALLRDRLVEIYLRWGLLGLEGLAIDGKPATVEALIDAGPMELSREIAAAIREECGLTEDERKN